MIELETERLYLRSPQQIDAPAINNALSKFEIAKNLARVEHPFPAGKAEQWIERHSNIEDPADTTFALFDHEQRFCGIAAFDIDGESRVPELGYYLDVPYWGKGLMSEAASAVVAWLFETSEVQRINSGAFTFNPASLAIQYKLGFKDVCTKDRMCVARGSEHPIVETALDRLDFKPL